MGVYKCCDKLRQWMVLEKVLYAHSKHQLESTCSNKFQHENKRGLYTFYVQMSDILLVILQNINCSMFDIGHYLGNVYALWKNYNG